MAVGCYRRALELQPNYADAHNNLGNALKDQGKLVEAAGCFRRALELKPDFAEAHNHLGNAFKVSAQSQYALALPSASSWPGVKLQRSVLFSPCR